MLVETICKAQKRDEKSVLEMIAQFECLLTRYAHLLKYEDALNDLTLDFIVLLKQVNTSIFFWEKRRCCCKLYCAND